MPIRRRLAGRLWPVLAILLAGASCVPILGQAGDSSNVPVSDPSNGNSILPGLATHDVVPAKGVDGRVVTRGGQPVSGVFVQAVLDGVRGGAVPEFAVFTDADGAFSYPLSAGDYILKFMRNGRAITVRSVHVPANHGIYIEVLVD